MFGGRIITVFVLIMLASVAWLASAQAATIQVPAQQATIAAALGAASAGDTIEITNSATYNEDYLGFDKAVTIVATAGQTPTIANGQSEPVFNMMGFSAAVQLGSVSGGQITIDCQAKGTGIFRMQTGADLTAENLKVIGAPVGGIAVAGDSGPNKAVFRKCIFDFDAGTSGAGTDACYAFQWYAQEVDWGFENCTFINSAAYGGVVLAGFKPGYNVAGNSSFKMSFKYCMGKFNGMGFFIANSKPSTGRNLLSIDQCWFESTDSGSYGFINAADTGTGGVFDLDVNINKSAIVGAIYGVNLRADTNRAGLLITNSDIKAKVGTAVRFENDTTTQRTMIIRDSNIIGPSFGINMESNPHPNTTVTSDHNNVIGTSYGAYGNVTPGTGDKSIDPGYTNWQAGDFTYAEDTLKTASTTGGPIGSAMNFANIVSVPVELSNFAAE